MQKNKRVKIKHTHICIIQKHVTIIIHSWLVHSWWKHKSFRFCWVGWHRSLHAAIFVTSRVSHAGGRRWWNVVGKFSSSSSRRCLSESRLRYPRAVTCDNARGWRIMRTARFCKARSLSYWALVYMLTFCVPGGAGLYVRDAWSAWGFACPVWRTWCAAHTIRAQLCGRRSAIYVACLC